MPDREQPNRWRCLRAGCNPILDENSAHTHNQETGHRVAKWPVRSAEGKRRAHIRNRSGYYDKYNVGAKSPIVRFGGRTTGFVDSDPEGWDGHKGAIG